MSIFFHVPPTLVGRNKVNITKGLLNVIGHLNHLKDLDLYLGYTLIIFWGRLRPSPTSISAAHQSNFIYILLYTYNNFFLGVGGIIYSVGNHMGLELAAEDPVLFDSMLNLTNLHITVE